MKRKVALILLVMTGIGFGAYQLCKTPSVDQISAKGVRGAHLALTGEPLFVFGDLYLDGRSAWLRKHFEERRQGALPDRAIIDAKMLAEPFTSGKWVEQLDAAALTHRLNCESQTMNTSVEFVVTGTTPEDVLVYLLWSGFLERLGKDGEYTVETYTQETLPKLDCVSVWPVLTANQVVTRESWNGGGLPLAQATDVIYLNEAKRDGDSIYLVYEVWSDCGKENHAQVRVAAGQFLLRDVSGAVAVQLTSFFRGQVMPFMDTMALTMTKNFYSRYAAFVPEDLLKWEPDEAARAWRAGLDL